MPPLTLDGTTGVSAVQTGAVESGDLASGAIGSGDLPAGSVIQVVSTTKKSGYTVSLSPNATDTQNVPGLEASITPINSNSKILVVHHGESGRPGLSENTGLVLFKNGSLLTEAVGTSDTGTAGEGVTSGGGEQGTGYDFCFLDNPSTASEITYGVRLRSVRVNATRTGSIGVVDDGTNSDIKNVNKLSTLTLMEIAG